MKVVCVDKCELLTCNKIYEVIFYAWKYDCYRILDDNNQISHYLTSRFISLDEYRERQLNKIGV